MLQCAAPWPQLALRRIMCRSRDREMPAGDWMELADSTRFVCDFGVEATILAGIMSLTTCVRRKRCFVGPVRAAIREIVAL
ncbi:hypothetical protein D6858_04735 [Tsuneonella suprasediminis]|uniref:Uncharacterized protein n=1 Tax=Tsuneonella suprasediminis TaxID=2306996 RepID=A0A419R3T6_9SPHN|nr:hypothetical protein D6858_04735 [Tsuneonella suprasediminis]